MVARLVLDEVERQALEQLAIRRGDDERDAFRRDDDVAFARLVESHRVVQRALLVAARGNPQAELVGVGLRRRDADLLRGVRGDGDHRSLSMLAGDPLAGTRGGLRNVPGPSGL